MTRSSNSEQERLAALPATNILVIAPAGCGKTEALAQRARSLVARGEAKAPRKVLAVTFSNKARDNLAVRMRKWIGPLWHRRVEVVNLHKLAARIVRAHGRVLGIPTDFKVREDRWYRESLKQLGVGFQDAEGLERALRQAKAGSVDDSEVMRRLEGGHGQAAALEKRLREAGLVDYDDLLRNAARLLSVSAVARLYRAHFPVTLADEVQDLSLTQFAIVQAVGGSAVTYAGDIAQGIYGFAGAAATEVFSLIKSLDPEIIEFKLSYRSAPAVLGAVNVIAERMGATVLECAEPEKWGDGGRVEYLESEDTEEEAVTVARRVQALLADDGGVAIGIIARVGKRLEHIRDALTELGVDYEDWTVATHSPVVAGLLKKHFRALSGSKASDEENLAALKARCLAAIDTSDVDTAREITEACATMGEAIADGVSLRNAVGACRVVPLRSDSLTAGVHVLSGHRGKGQEFDWVFVIGLEDGHIPDFRNTDDPEEERLLHVMLSRAKYGLVLTRSRHVWSKRGWWARAPSRWLAPLLEVATPVTTADE